MNEVKQLSKHAADVAELMKALAHKERLMVLCMLTQGERCVSDLLAVSELSQSAFSQQLSVLKRLNLIKARKSSLNVFYSIADEKVKKVMKVLHDIYCK